MTSLLPIAPSADAAAARTSASPEGQPRPRGRGARGGEAAKGASRRADPARSTGRPRRGPARAATGTDASGVDPARCAAGATAELTREVDGAGGERISMGGPADSLAAARASSASAPESAPVVHAFLTALRRRPEAQRGSAHFGRWLGQGAHLEIRRQPGEAPQVIVRRRTEFELSWIRTRCGVALQAVALELLGPNATVEFLLAPDLQSDDVPTDSTTDVGSGAAAPRSTSPSSAAPLAPRADGFPLGHSGRHASSSAARHGAIDRTDGEFSSGPAAPPAPHAALRPSLEEFVVGPSNQVAYQAAVQMVDGQGPRSVFIDGACGVGKTHLLRALCNRRREMHPGAEVLYTTGESFTNEFIAALRAHQLEAFRARIRRLDLLAIDDVHFLADKDRTSSEFLHTIDHIGRHCNQVILASDAPLDRLQAFSQALRSRLMQGVLVHIDLPDAELRRALVRRLAQRRGLRLTEDAEQRLAHRIEGTAREIEGALQRISLEVSMRSVGRRQIAHFPAAATNPATTPVATAPAHPEMGDGAGRDEVRPAAPTPPGTVDATMVDVALHDLAGGHQAPLRPQSIVGAVCTLLNLDRSDLLGSSRHPQIVLGRMLVTAVARRCTTLSFPEIGQLLGRAAHSTVHHAWRRAQSLLASGTRIPDAVETGPTTFSELLEQTRRIARRPG